MLRMARAICLTMMLLKKYMMKKDTKTPFFLKENNCVDGKHYYALVEAEIAKVYDKDNKKYRWM